MFESIQEFFDNSFFAQLKEYINFFTEDIIPKVKLFVPSQLLPFIAIALVIAIVLLILGRS